MDPAEVAAYDQAYAAFTDQMIFLQELARRLVAAVGVEQAGADLTVYLIEHYGNGDRQPSVLATIAARSLVDQVTA